MQHKDFLKNVYILEIVKKKKEFNLHITIDVHKISLKSCFLFHYTVLKNIYAEILYGGLSRSMNWNRKILISHMFFINNIWHIIGNLC